MQPVQTRILMGRPSLMAFTFWRLGYQRRLVLLWAWLMLYPFWGLLPQMSHTFAMTGLLYDTQRT